MRPKFTTLFYAGLLALLACLFWSVWASAQTNSAASAPAAAGTTNAPARAAIPAGFVFVPEPVTFGLDGVAALQSALLGRPLWQYVAFLIYVAGAFFVSWLINFLVRVVLQRLVAGTQTVAADRLLKLAAGPVKVVAFVILLHIGLRIFTWPDWMEAVLSKGLKLVVAVSLTYVALRCVDVFMDVWKERAARDSAHPLDQHVFPLIRNSAKAFIVVVAILVTAQNLGVNITSLLASLSIGGLALGLAAQDTLANLFAAVAIFLDKPFRIGDRILVDAIDGTVELIGLRSTRVRTANGHLVSIPNKAMGNATITNVSERPNIRTEMNLGLTYDTPNEKLREALGILETVYRGHPMTHDVWVNFNKFADSALNIQIIHWWNAQDQRAYLAGMQELNLAVKQRLEAAGVEFAFPTQTVQVKQAAPKV
ncbi:mechanosensitive ion channel protein MscL [Verrucomicrobiota bacterium]|nr:mechanosensitive ion channel protein MscL [Verrucomicrobiota bacterium]